METISGSSKAGSPQQQQQQQIGRFSKLHATLMAQNLPEIGRLPNLGVKINKTVYKNREAPSEIGRVGISVKCFLYPHGFGWLTFHILISGLNIMQAKHQSWLFKNQTMNLSKNNIILNLYPGTEPWGKGQSLWRFQKGKIKKNGVFLCKKLLKWAFL